MSAISAARVTVGTTAILLQAADGDGTHVSVNNTSAVVIYLGDSSVDITEGYPVAVGAQFSIDLGPAVSLYAIAGTITNLVQVISTDR